MDDRSDENLVAAARRGQRDAYALLVRRHAGRVFALCLGIVGSVHDAEDVTQDTFVKGFTDMRHLRADRHFPAWIARIARNGCLDLLRRKKRGVEMLIDVQAESQPQGDLDGELHAAIGRLPQEYRLPLVLYYFDGQSTKNVAETLNITPAAVHTRISRARRELRKILTEQGDTP